MLEPEKGRSGEEKSIGIVIYCVILKLKNIYCLKWHTMALTLAGDKSSRSELGRELMDAAKHAEKNGSQIKYVKNLNFQINSF
jgi:hypothetical protein